MYKVSDFTKNYYKPSEVADLFNVSAQTIRNRVQAGELTCIRTEGGHRLITRESLLSYLKSSNMLYEDIANDKYDVIYARVSSHEQKEKGDLDRQVSCIIEHMQGLSNVLVLKEVGSGLNDKRKQLLKLLSLVFEDKVRTVCITYRDRLTRFGSNYLKFIFDAHNVKLYVLNDIGEDKTAQIELVEDMMSLIASFSGKLYGMRSHKKGKNND